MTQHTNIPRETPAPLSTWADSPWRATREDGHLYVEFSMSKATTITLDQAKAALAHGDFRRFPEFKGTAAHKDEARRILMLFVGGTS